MTILVMGRGAVGRALVAGFKAREIGRIGSFGVRALQAQALSQQYVAADYDAVVYAGGPAGEAACRRDPARAFAEHYTAIQAWVTWANHPQPRPARRLILIGTVQTEGYYGSLKALAADWARDHVTYGHLLHLRCGQIIGPEMPVDGTGVVATWIREAVAGQVPRTPGPAPPLEVTLGADLIERIVTWLAAPGAPAWEDERLCLPDPVQLWALADLCGDVAGGLAVEDTPLTRALAGMVQNARRVGAAAS